MYKSVKFFINSAINALKFVQFCLVLFALLTMTDFILFLLHIKLPPFIQVIFDTIYAAQSVIYKPNLSILPVDFTLVIAAIEMLVVAGFIVYVLNFIIEFEQVFDKVQRDGQRRFEKNFNTQLKKNVVNVEVKRNSFAMLYKIEIEPMFKQYAFEEKVVNTKEVSIKYNTMFLNLMKQSFNARNISLSDSNLLIFNDVNMCNDVFRRLYEFIKQSKEGLKQNNLKFNLKTAVCIAGIQDAQDSYVPKLRKLINIAVPGKIMSLADFKIRYETLKDKPFKINSIGEYGMNTEIIDVYTLEP